MADEKQVKSITTTARVTVTLEVTVQSTWNSGVTLEQVHREAVNAAFNRMDTLFGDEEKSRGVRVASRPAAADIILTCNVR